ncbi:MAG: response regulator [Myxococcota bacterium]
MGKTILVADDSDTIRKAVEMTFRATEFSVVSASSGDDALGQLDRVKPDVVLADCIMDGIDGYTMCARIKDAGHAIPVVLMASTYQPIDRRRAEMARANTSVSKPFDTKTLLSIVRQLTGAETATDEAPLTFADALARRNQPESEPEAGDSGFDVPMLAPEPGSEYAVGSADIIIDDEPEIIEEVDGLQPIAPSAPPRAPSVRTPAPSIRTPREPSIREPAPAFASATGSLSALPESPSRPSPAATGSILPGPPSPALVSADALSSAPSVAANMTGPTLEPPMPPDGMAGRRPDVDVWSLTENERSAVEAEPMPLHARSTDFSSNDLQDHAPTVSAEPEPIGGPGTADSTDAASAAASLGMPKEEIRQMIREAVEKVVWEVVPELAETIIREEIRRLTAKDESA